MFLGDLMLHHAGNDLISLNRTQPSHSGSPCCFVKVIFNRYSFENLRYDSNSSSSVKVCEPLSVGAFCSQNGVEAFGGEKKLKLPPLKRYYRYLALQNSAACVEKSCAFVVEAFSCYV